jgi:hypothetical protein
VIASVIKVKSCRRYDDLLPRRSSDMEALKSNLSGSDHGSEERSDVLVDEHSQDPSSNQPEDVFVDDDTHEIRYKTLSWQA